jgi:hypothetical protein
MCCVTRHWAESTGYVCTCTLDVVSILEEFYLSKQMYLNLVCFLKTLMMNAIAVLEESRERSHLSKTLDGHRESTMTAEYVYRRLL